MKTFFKLLIIFGLIFIPCLKVLAIEEDITDELRQTTQEGEILLTPQSIDLESNSENPKEVEELYTDAEIDEKVFEALNNAEKTTTEDSLLGRVLHSKITRTDIPSYLLQEELTFKFNKGPVSKLEPFGAYRGSVSSLFRPDYTTRYDNLVTEVGVMGEFKNPNYKFRAAFFPIPVANSNYARNLFSDLYIMNTSIPHHQVYLGYSRIQTGMEGGGSTYTIPFVARSQIARNFGNKRSVSAKVVGNYEYIDYAVSVGSASRSLIGGMQGAEFNTWVNIKPFGKKEEKYGRLTIGGGYDGGRSLSHNFSVLSGYVGYKYKKLWTTFEVGIADGYHGSNGSHKERACGYAYTVGWKFNPHLQVIGRIDQFDPDRSVDNNIKREYTAGINWFIKGQALKLMLNYVFCQNQNSQDSHKIILATQVVL